MLQYSNVTDSPFSCWQAHARILRETKATEEAAREVAARAEAQAVMAAQQRRSPARRKESRDRSPSQKRSRSPSGDRGRDQHSDRNRGRAVDSASRFNRANRPQEHDRYPRAVAGRDRRSEPLPRRSRPAVHAAPEAPLSPEEGEVLENDTFPDVKRSRLSTGTAIDTAAVLPALPAVSAGAAQLPAPPPAREVARAATAAEAATTMALPSTMALPPPPPPAAGWGSAPAAASHAEDTATQSATDQPHNPASGAEGDATGNPSKSAACGVETASRPGIRRDEAALHIHSAPNGISGAALDPVAGGVSGKTAAVVTPEGPSTATGHSSPAKALHAADRMLPPAAFSSLGDAAHLARRVPRPVLSPDKEMSRMMKVFLQASF